MSDQKQLDKMYKAAMNYEERFWYEQPDNIKSKISLAFRAGYIACAESLLKEKEEEIIKIGKAIKKHSFEVIDTFRKQVVEVSQINYEFDIGGYDIIEEPEF